MSSLADVIARGRKKNKTSSINSNPGQDNDVTVLAPVTEKPTQPEHIEAVNVPRFDIQSDAEKIPTYLSENGYVVIRNVLSHDEIQNAIQMLWEFLSTHAAMFRDDPSTWTDENFKKIGSKISGIIGGNGFGHSEFQWFIRSRPIIKCIFELLFEESDLVASFDGGNVFRPWQRPELVHACTSSGWFHVDQGRTLLGKQCIQGLVTLTDCTDESGGFCCIPKSHMQFSELMTHARDDGNYLLVPPNFPALKDPQILPILEAGDMILWDSRTIHCSTPALRKPSANPDKLLRVASYQCMTPRRWASPDVLGKRVGAYERSMTTTHWPHLATYKILESVPKSKNLSAAPMEIQALV